MNLTSPVIIMNRICGFGDRVLPRLVAWLLVVCIVVSGMLPRFSLEREDLSTLSQALKANRSAVTTVLSLHMTAVNLFKRFFTPDNEGKVDGGRSQQREEHDSPAESPAQPAHGHAAGDAAFNVYGSQQVFREGDHAGFARLAVPVQFETQRDGPGCGLLSFVQSFLILLLLLVLIQACRARGDISSHADRFFSISLFGNRTSPTPGFSFCNKNLCRTGSLS